MAQLETINKQLFDAARIFRSICNGAANARRTAVQDKLDDGKKPKEAQEEPRALEMMHDQHEPSGIGLQPDKGLVDRKKLRMQMSRPQIRYLDELKRYRGVEGTVRQCGMNEPASRGPRGQDQKVIDELFERLKAFRLFTNLGRREIDGKEG